MKGNGLSNIEEDYDSDDFFSNGRSLAQTGTKSLLVIRIDALDSSTSASEAVLSDKIFGSVNGDQNNLKSQYAKCSYNQLVFVKATSNLVNNGVFTLSMPDTTITGIENGVIRAAALAQAADELGDLQTIADYTMLCMPPGTAGGWIAYAYVNWYVSVYNDQWCTFPSAQLHEIGKCENAYLATYELVKHIPQLHLTSSHYS